MGVRGDTTVKYVDSVSGGDAMTMIVLISRGLEDISHPPFLVFKNRDRIYPIRGIADNVPRFSYRTGPKGWIYTSVFQQWLSKPRSIEPP